MHIEQRDEGEVTFLSLSGQFETTSLPAVRERIEGLIESGRRELCLNLRALSFVNSTALGYLVEVSKRLKDLDGELVFSEPSRFLADTIRTLELHLLFEVCASDADAATYFAG